MKVGSFEKIPPSVKLMRVSAFAIQEPFKYGFDNLVPHRQCKDFQAPEQGTIMDIPPTRYDRVQITLVVLYFCIVFLVVSYIEYSIFLRQVTLVLRQDLGWSQHSFTTSGPRPEQLASQVGL